MQIGSCALPTPLFSHICESAEHLFGHQRGTYSPSSVAFSGSQTGHTFHTVSYLQVGQMPNLKQSSMAMFAGMPPTASAVLMRTAHLGVDQAQMRVGRAHLGTANGSSQLGHLAAEGLPFVGAQE